VLLNGTVTVSNEGVVCSLRFKIGALKFSL
jgi:hypothetical protein